MLNLGPKGLTFIVKAGKNCRFKQHATLFFFKSDSSFIINPLLLFSPSDKQSRFRNHEFRRKSDKTGNWCHGMYTPAIPVIDYCYKIVRKSVHQ